MVLGKYLRVEIITFILVFSSLPGLVTIQTDTVDPASTAKLGQQRTRL